MRKLLNTLYIFSQNVSVSIDHENVVIKDENKNILGKKPLINIRSIIIFSYAGCSPQLMQYCMENNISLSFVSPSGRFYGSVIGETNGSVFTRQKQYKISQDNEKSLEITKNIIYAKCYNQKYIINRCMRDHPYNINVEKFRKTNEYVKNYMKEIDKATSKDEIRGIEGTVARLYFSIFNDMILQQKEDFIFKERNKRPPTDYVNSMLSFLYTVLYNDVSSAICVAGLDPYIGFLHTDLSGRKSLSCDLMEELRPLLVDKVVLSLINLKQISSKDFEIQASGVVMISNDGKKTIIEAYQNKKKDFIRHRFLKEKIEYGNIPFVQANLLSKFIREEIDSYPPFFIS